jgi:Mg2+ and Co2+ transporter CorA
MTNRYDIALQDLEDEIKHLEGRIERFTARGVRLERIPAIRAEIAKKRASIPTLRGTAALCRGMYGECSEVGQQ